MLACVVDKPICAFRRDNMCIREEHCEPIGIQCQGCKRVLPNLGTFYCVSYPVPQVHWRRGNCPLASHIPALAQTTAKINPLKLARALRRQGL